MTEQYYVQPMIAGSDVAIGRSENPRPFLGRPDQVLGVRLLARREDDPARRSVDAAGPADLEALAGQFGDRAAESAARALARIAAPPPAVAGVTLERPRIMGVLNVTPDSFSDGGAHLAPEACRARAEEMARCGVDFLDIGGESTRPGAEFVPAEIERARVLPAIAAIRASGVGAPISIDTRKPEIARDAFEAGARIWNDVSSLGYAADGLETAAALTRGATGGWVCLMHAQGEPKTMQSAPRYDDALLDVYDLLARRLEAAVAAGAPESRVILDPGIGFGKTLAHNLAILRGLALFSTLGAPLLLGASRKRFIGALSGENDAARRAPGSVAAALWSASQGARILRAHDVEETAQALSVWSALVAEEDMEGASS